MRKSTFIAVLFVLASGLIGGCAKQDDGRIPVTTKSARARELFCEGMALCDRFHTDQARAKMQEALEIDPDFALGYLGLACSELRQGVQYESLQQAYDMARPVERRSPPNLTLGVSVLGRSDNDNLRRASKLIDKVSPAERLWIEGLRLSLAGDKAGTIASFRQLADLRPKDPLAHRLLGDCYLRFELPDSAIAAYERALALDSTLVNLYNVLGYEYFAIGNSEVAEKMFKTYAARLPDEPNPCDSYAEFLLRNGRYEEALAWYRKALEIDSGFINSRIGIATILSMLKRTNEARAELAQQKRISTGVSEQLILELAEALTYLYEQDYKGCIKVLEARGKSAHIKSSPIDEANNYDILGEVLSFAGRVDEAEAKLKKSLEIIRGADLQTGYRNQYEIRHRIRTCIYVDIPRKGVECTDRDVQRLELLKKSEADSAGGEALASSLHVIRGLLAHQEHNYSVAVSELKDSGLRSARVSYYIGNSYEMIDDPDAAAEWYRKAAAINRLFDFPHALYYPLAVIALQRINRPIA
ncbi:tetratricopeptide repeat protein [bacterium]|nr:tetratricopeptide repeat protein [bacterium]